ncbi:hypothetical protein [Enhygromyxa salina]|uniref:Uncharacterized protein n=1 Tax=Enhygromyxa salina TaxID=215803 RepID=A0A2S9XX56_9BACT|nr:hypothetical protein [Enhygromyxa salina]PRP97301.1 hypothetical protein ENSA7_66510 [Enhygromyxa salina]
MAQSILEPVAAGQTRFRMQGLAPDARGIAVGREALIVFESLDRCVAFLGAYSVEASLDDLLPSMTLERARRSGGGTALLLRCEAGDGYVLDRLARLAGAARSQLYPGAGSVFVRYRESQAPFGYDLALPIGELLAREGNSAGLSVDEVLVVDREFLSRFRSDDRRGGAGQGTRGPGGDRIDPIELIQRLQLRPVALPLEGIASDPELCGMRDMALVLVAPGIAERVLAYLWRKEISMAGIRVALAEDRRASLLLRLRNPPGRILDVLRPIPGVELLVPVSPRAAVEVGWTHPIHLASASSCLPGDEMYLFRGRAGRVERIDGAPRFVDGRYLVQTEVRLREPEFEVEPVRMQESGPLEVDLRLQASSMAREPRASLIAWTDLELLRRLIYLVPPSALAAARLVPLTAGLLIVAGGARLGRDGRALSVGTVIPLGQRFCEVAPGVLVPDGFELWPRLRPQLVRELLGLEGEDRALFLAPGSDPIHIADDRMLSLDAASIGTLEASEADLVEPSLPALEPGTITNQRLGRFALWGFRSQSD